MKREGNSLLRSSILRDIPHYGVMCSDHALAQKKTLQIVDLEHQSLVVLNDQYRSLSIFFEKCCEAGFHPNITRKASEISSIFLICKQGKEIGIIPEFAVNDVQTIPGLIAVPFDDTMCNHIYCIQKKNRKPVFSVFN